MKKRFCLFLALLFLSISALSASAEELQIPEPTLSPNALPYDDTKPEDLSADQLYAVSAILVSSETGEVIFEKNADELRAPASTTKILTGLLAIQNMDDLEQIVTVSDYAVMAVNAIGAAYGIGRCERVFESSARIATNCRVHGLFSDYSENLDVWIEGTAKTTDGFVEFGAYLSDIWHIDGENDSDIAFCHMYSQLFKRV